MKIKLRKYIMTILPILTVHLFHKQIRVGNNQEVKREGWQDAGPVEPSRDDRARARGTPSSRRLAGERAFFPTPEYQCHIIMCDLGSYCAIYIHRPPPLTSYSVLKTPVTFPRELFNSIIRFQIFNLFSLLEV